MDIFIVVVELLLFISVTREEKNAPPCYETVNCGEFRIKCDVGSKIRLQSYQYKECDGQNNKCFLSSGCCTFEEEDCREPYSTLHVYDLMRSCSGRNSCGPSGAPSKELAPCSDNGSRDVYLQYDCFKNETFIHMCDDRNIRGNASETNLIFDQTADTLRQPKSCICETNVTDGAKVDINSVDERMFSAHSGTGTGSLCSSAVLRGELELNCQANLSEEYNLHYNLSKSVTFNENGTLMFILDKLYDRDEDDRPVIVWLHLNASGTLQTKCHSEYRPPTIPTQPLTVTTTAINTGSTTISPVKDGHDDTTDNSKPGEEGDSTAVIVGILITVIITVIAAIVLFILCKRRHRPLKRRPVVQNSYTDSLGSRNSTVVVHDTEYDEIRDAPDALRRPLYDPVYELAKESPHVYVNVRPNGAAVCEDQAEPAEKKHHTYQNIKNKDDSKSNNVSAKLPFGEFITEKSQLLSFFRRKNDNLPPPGITKRQSIASVTSYDHFNTGNLEVLFQVKPPPNDTRNRYSRTNASYPYSYIETNKPNIHIDTNVNTTDMKELPNVIKNSASPKGFKAVEVGDSYIEFQFNTLDDNNLNLLRLKSKICEENVKLEKPNRFLPKPSSHKLDKAGKVLRDSTLPAPTEKPNEIDDQQAYDYAVADKNEQTAGSLMFRHLSQTDKADKSDSRDGAIVYSYADIDDDEDQNTKNLTAEHDYEDVDHSADSGLRKCKSFQDILCDSGGYEIPVKGIGTRPLSVPHIVTTRDKQNTESAIKGIESTVNEVASTVGLGNAVKELKEIEDLPDLSDPEALPKELKYANLGLHTLDDNKLNLLQLKSKICEENIKLKIPNRFPPKPFSHKLDKAGEVLRDSSLPAPTEKPNEIDDQQTYDYAVADKNEQTRGFLMFKHLSQTDNADKSDSRDGAIVNSYADIDDDEDQNTKNLTAEYEYEDVDHSADSGLRKCKSFQDILCDSGEYEIPVKGIGTRPLSVPHIITAKDKLNTESAIKSIESTVNKVASTVGLGNAVKELKEIEDLPDLSDPEAFPKEPKYANLGLHTLDDNDLNLLQPKSKICDTIEILLYDGKCLKINLRK